MSLYVLPGKLPDVCECSVLLFAVLLTCIEYQTGEEEKQHLSSCSRLFHWFLIGSFQGFSGTSAAQNNGVPTRPRTFPRLASSAPAIIHRRKTRKPASRSCRSRAI